MFFIMIGGALYYFPNLERVYLQRYNCDSLDKYIRNTVQVWMLVVISMLTTLDVIFSMLDQMADTDEYFSIQNAVTFVLLTTPTTVYEMLPFAALGGALIGLGIISSNNELVVMRSAGISVYRIVFYFKPTS